MLATQDEQLSNELESAEFSANRIRGLVQTGQDVEAFRFALREHAEKTAVTILSLTSVPYFQQQYSVLLSHQWLCSFLQQAEKSTTSELQNSIYTLISKYVATQVGSKRKAGTNDFDTEFDIVLNRVSDECVAKMICYFTQVDTTLFRAIVNAKYPKSTLQFLVTFGDDPSAVFVQSLLNITRRASDTEIQAYATQMSKLIKHQIPVKWLAEFNKNFELFEFACQTGATTDEAIQALFQIHSPTTASRSKHI
jgi:hypothetical protein